MKSSLRFFSLSVLAASAVFAWAGCGGEKAETAAPQSDAPAITHSQSDLTPDQSVTITANDLMKYSQTRIEAKAGQVLSITLDNVGKMPKAAMGHNLVVLHQGVDPKELALQAARASEHDYLPPSEAGSIIAATHLLGGGETDTIVFQLPDEPGLYPYLCTFPGHFQAGMKGVIVVE